MSYKYKLLCSVFESPCPQVIRAGPKLQHFISLSFVLEQGENIKHYFEAFHPF